MRKKSDLPQNPGDIFCIVGGVKIREVEGMFVRCVKGDERDNMEYVKVLQMEKC